MPFDSGSNRVLLPAGVSKGLVKAAAQPLQPLSRSQPCTQTVTAHRGHFLEGQLTPGFLGKPQDRSKVLGSSSPNPWKMERSGENLRVPGKLGFVAHLSRPG